MYYEYDITVAANTTEASPKKQKLTLAHGIIHRIEVQFPIGCAGLAHCRLRHHTFGPLPSNPSGSFKSDGYVIPIDENLEFFRAPFTVDAICWNDDDTYSHTLTIRFGIYESKTMLFVMSLFKGLEKMLKLMGIKV